MLREFVISPNGKLGLRKKFATKYKTLLRAMYENLDLSIFEDGIGGKLGVKAKSNKRRKNHRCVLHKKRALPNCITHHYPHSYPLLALWKQILDDSSLLEYDEL